eukprot:3938964-Rhodomonas_salina.1
MKVGSIVTAVDNERGSTTDVLLVLLGTTAVLVTVLFWSSGLVLLCSSCTYCVVLPSVWPSVWPMVWYGLRHADTRPVWTGRA